MDNKLLENKTKNHPPNKKDHDGQMIPLKRKGMLEEQGREEGLFDVFLRGIEIRYLFQMDNPTNSLFAGFMKGDEAVLNV